MNVQPCVKCGTENEPHIAMCVQCGEPVPGSTAEEMLGETLLGVYEVTSILGQGGMSIVYRGRHKLTEQLVAIKVLPPELAVHTALKQRFLEEARALAKLEHPNIVRLYNFGEDKGRLCLVMQLVEGETFERMIIDQGRIPPLRALKITVEVLRALEYAHANEIVHRDIKPSNILVSGAGVYVMDFGIARMKQQSSRLTETGQTMGTVRYMSPEQVRGLVVDHRSDLYSLGITFYEALCGETPFEGDTHFDVMTKHLNQQPEPPSKHGVELEPGLEAALLHSLAKAPADRFQSAREMRQAFEAAAGKSLAADSQATMAKAAIVAEASGDDAVVTAPQRPRKPAAAGPAAEGPAAASARASLAAPTAGTGLADRLEPVLARPRKSHGLLYVAMGVSAVALGAVGYLVLHNRGGASAGKPKPPVVVKGKPPAARPHGWMEPHKVALNMSHAVDVKVETPAPLRVMAGAGNDPAALATRYAAVVGSFGTYLKDVHRTETLDVEPLTLAIVPGEFLSRPELWPGWEVDSKTAYGHRYDADSATYFVAEGAVDAEVDYGFAMHLCFASWASMSAAYDDCPTLVEGFEHALKQRREQGVEPGGSQDPRKTPGPGGRSQPAPGKSQGPVGKHH